MVSPEYVWITQGFYDEDWWMMSQNSSCSPEVLKAALNNSLAIALDGYFVNENKSEKAISTLVRVGSTEYHIVSTLQRIKFLKF